MRAGLRDDRFPVASAVTVALDDDCGSCGCCESCSSTPECDDPGWLGRFELRRRFRDGYDPDGNPMFVWETLARGGALVQETRTEWDSQAGVTVVVGDIRMANPGLADISETAVVVELADPEVMWMITGSQVTEAMIELKVRRVDGS
jgi:hypothetical protein